MIVHIDHVTSATYRPGEGNVKTRVGLDLDQRQNDVVVFGEEAEEIWRILQKFKA